MSGQEYQAALRDRGFYYHASLDRWVGPFNITVSGFFNNDAISTANTARLDSLAEIDERLRAAREGFRPQSFGGPGPGLL